MKTKRGAIEIQFNWLFVLIIGAVILVIFSTIILKQKKASETSQNALLLRNLDAILAGSETTQGTVNLVDIPETRIEFRCNRYSIGSISKQVEVMSVFTPSVFEGDQLISMTLDWSVPFRITNLIYITSPTYRYVFVGQDTLATQLFGLMPNESFSEWFDTAGAVNYRGENKIRFVFFDDSIEDGKFVPDDFAMLPDDDVSVLNIRGNLHTGTVDFYAKEGERFSFLDSAPYVKQESLLGAVISDAPNVYTCIMENVFNKLKVVADIYLEKTNKLKEGYRSTNNRCAELLTTAYNLNALNQLTSISFDEASIAKLLDAEQQLKIQNKQAQLQSCATIY